MDIGLVGVPDFQNHIASIGLPIEAMLLEQVGQRKSARRKEPFLKSFFLLVSGFCIID